MLPLCWVNRFTHLLVTYFYIQLLATTGTQVLVKSVTQRVLGNFYPDVGLVIVEPTLGNLLGEKLPNTATV